MFCFFIFLSSIRNDFSISFVFTKIMEKMPDVMIGRKNNHRASILIIAFS
jgi:hypothetical protein